MDWLGAVKAVCDLLSLRCPHLDDMAYNNCPNKKTSSHEDAWNKRRLPCRSAEKVVKRDCHRMDGFYRYEWTNTFLWIGCFFLGVISMDLICNIHNDLILQYIYQDNRGNVKLPFRSMKCIFQYFVARQSRHSPTKRTLIDFSYLMDRRI